MKTRTTIYEKNMNNNLNTPDKFCEATSTRFIVFCPLQMSQITFSQILYTIKLKFFTYNKQKETKTNPNTFKH